MAEKRMFTKKITDSDEFISLSSSCQALYMHLCLSADDDGFNNQVTLAMLKAHASSDDVKVLLAKRFIIQFESGVIVIKGWRMANAIRRDRYVPTSYQEEFNQLKIKDNGSYTFEDVVECQSGDNWLPDGCQKVAVDKDSIGKDSIGKDSIDKERGSRFTPPTLEDVTAYCLERGNNIDPQHFIDFYEGKGWMVGKNKMKDWKACVRTWESREKPKTESKFSKEY